MTRRPTPAPRYERVAAILSRVVVFALWPLISLFFIVLLLAAWPYILFVSMDEK